ncbi:hypothetical protein [Fictibacillus phosphorivorans]|uniref:hypothetical protein n=1 Tax=Fictibacillus phosphorivorans TaxID=1221500 RepID=UPI00203B7D8B|nr:hypothetical protein [Fictibacillus phosphorivorans]MCM3717377.1 hypothetical protein [Fictibacillus phosphorivorans]MCM3775072.1 hypothetical protein [Fictibacillus phosphorivorans]
MGKYRIFFVYRIKDLNYVHVHGMNMEDKKLFTVLVPSPNDHIDLGQHQEQLPEELLSVLKSESGRINAGIYDLAHWEPYTYS